MSSKEQIRSNKKRTGKRLSGSAPVSSSRHEPGAKNVKRSRRQIFIIVGIVLVVILGILAIPFYQNYIAPFNRTIITVDNIQISMRYFLERTRLAGSDVMSMLDSLTSEQVIKIMAPQYGIQVTDADIDSALRSMASGGTGDISDIEFEEWYRQLLNDNKVSDSLYREIVGTSLLASRLQTYLADRMPTVAEQVHLHMITVLTYEEAQAAEARLEAGEDFAAVAREVSIDSSVKENGGDQGWLPPVILSDYQSLIEALDIGEVSAIIPYYSSSSQSTSSSSSTPSAYYIFMVSEKDSDRELSEYNLLVLKSKALELWLKAEIPNHTIAYNFNSEIYAWIDWQLEKDSEQTSGG